MQFTFTYRGKVRGQGRPRFAHGHAYESKMDRQYKQDLAWQYKAQRGPHFGNQPLSVTIDVMRALPKSTPKLVAVMDDVKKPDCDNIAKALLDALNGLAFGDDAQVVALVVRKYPRIRADCDWMRVTIATIANDLVYPYEYATE